MTVQQFIDKLQALPPDIKQLPVYVSTTYYGELDGEEEIPLLDHLEHWVLNANDDEYYDAIPCSKYPKRFHIGA